MNTSPLLRQQCGARSAAFSGLSACPRDAAARSSASAATSAPLRCSFGASDGLSAAASRSSGKRAHRLARRAFNVVAQAAGDKMVVSITGAQRSVPSKPVLRSAQGMRLARHGSHSMGSEPGERSLPVLRRAYLTLSARGMLCMDCAGATGLVGSRLAAKLAAQGHRVRVLTRDVSSARSKMAGYAGLEFYGPAEWAKAIAGSTGVVNLAGEPIATR